jgi:allantoin racemase
MNIMVINPNSSEEMTHHLEKELMQIKRADTELSVVCPSTGPISIESNYDAVIAASCMLPLVREANTKGYDAVIIACFSDPGIEAAKEISDILVVGIQEVSLHVAAMLGAKFTILTPLEKRIPAKEYEVRRYKLEQALASVRPLGMTVAETDANPAKTKARILEVAKKAVEEDGAEVIVLGCAGMVGYAAEVERQLGIKVIDPSSVTLKICEGMVDAGLKHAKRAFYATPPAKLFKGMGCNG